ncbi:MAG: hypothetical protein DME18_04455 [Verrucomicrobia bacterium]|nr:MAG: hypothetical protein DME18_04455 [Verrucomicrobiota bacterium]
MAGFAAKGSGTSIASQDHAAIILLLLLLLGTVLLIGAFLVGAIRRYLRARGRGLFAGSGRQTHAGFRNRRFLQSPVFHCPNRWVAIQSANPQAVQAALGLHNPTPCSWTDGMARVSDQKLFISPPVDGWILVVGVLLPEPGEDVDVCFRFLQRLSRELGEVQYFSVNHAVGHHAWARFERGRAIRGYAWAGETLWNQGRKTWAERKLGLTCYDYCEGETGNHITELERSRANTEKVLLLASIWSLDPSSIDDHALSDVLGIAGDLSQARQR